MTLVTALNRFVDVAGARFGYRRLGPDHGVPLVLLQHFTGTIDSWDPALVDALAVHRPVILFNNRGVGTSTGEVPATIEAMAADASAFLAALGLDRVDLLGFSLGGFVAQLLAAALGSPVRKLILAGTAPRGGEEHLLAVLEDAERKRGDADIRLPLFFTASAQGQAAGHAFLARQSARQDRDPDRGEAVSGPQAEALIGWCAAPDEGDALLRSIRQPTLAMSGSDDTMLPAINAWRMAQAMPNAQLVVYPDAGHGALFQDPALFAAHACLFLDGEM